MHYGARFYSPRLGRFVSADSIVPEPGDPQALNRYAYVLNNPVIYRDPSGHCIPGVNCPGSLYEDGPMVSPLLPRATPTLPSGPPEPRATGMPIPTPTPQAAWGENAAEWVRILELDRFMMDSSVGLGLYGNPIIPPGLKVVNLSTPWLSAQAGIHVSTRMEAGPGAAVRIDQSKATWRIGDAVEMQGDVTTGQGAIVFKGDQQHISGPFSMRGKTTVAGQPIPPLNYAIGTAGSVEFAGRNDNLAVKIEPIMWANYTIHGGPTLTTGFAAGLVLSGGALSKMKIIPAVRQIPAGAY